MALRVQQHTPASLSAAAVLCGCVALAGCTQLESGGANRGGAKEAQASGAAPQAPEEKPQPPGKVELHTLEATPWAQAPESIKGTIRVQWPSAGQWRTIPVILEWSQYKLAVRRVGTTGPDLTPVTWHCMELHSLDADVPYLWCWGPVLVAGYPVLIAGGDGHSYLAWSGPSPFGGAFADVSMPIGREEMVARELARDPDGPWPGIVEVGLRTTVGMGPFWSENTYCRDIHFDSIDQSEPGKWVVVLHGVDPKVKYKLTYDGKAWHRVK